MREADDFVDDMLARGRDWMAIMSVAGVVRHGSWKDRAEEMLLERKLMPESKAERADLINKSIKAAENIVK